MMMMANKYGSMKQHWPELLHFFLASHGWICSCVYMETARPTYVNQNKAIQLT